MYQSKVHAPKALKDLCYLRWKWGGSEAIVPQARFHIGLQDIILPYMMMT